MTDDALLGYSPGVYDIELSEIELEYLDGLTERPLGAAYTIYRPFYGSIGLSQGYSTSHPAFDWPVSMNTKLYNMFPHQARVSFAGYTSEGYAYQVRVLSAEYNLMSLVAHMPANGLRVKTGDMVDVIQLVGLSDNTGNSTGPHVHTEIRKAPFAGYANCVNFWSWLKPLPSEPPAPPPPPPVEKKIIDLAGVHVNGKKYAGRVTEV